MSRLLTSVDERTVTMMLRQEIPAITVSSISAFTRHVPTVVSLRSTINSSSSFPYEQIEQAPGVPVVFHGDLHGWNIVLNPISNQLAGVFDFNGACIGDRHLDFRYFFCLDPSLHDAIIAQYQQLSGQALSTPRGILYGAATDLSDLVYCTEENMPIVDGPISTRIAHLIQIMKMYGLL